MADGWVREEEFILKSAILNRSVCKRAGRFSVSHALIIMEICTLVMACPHPSCSAHAHTALDCTAAALIHGSKVTSEPEEAEPPAVPLSSEQKLQQDSLPLKSGKKSPASINIQLQFSSGLLVFFAALGLQIVTFAVAAGLLAEAGISYTVLGSLSHECSYVSRYVLTPKTF